MRSIFAILIGIAVWCGLLVYSAHALGLLGPGGGAGAGENFTVTYGAGWGDSDTGARMSPIDRAQIAVAKSALNQAEMAEEIYALDHSCYASTLDELRTEDPAVPGSVRVARSDCRGYRIEVTALDGSATVCSLDQDNGQTEYHALPSKNPG